jgi:penicillin-binding protein 2
VLLVVSVVGILIFGSVLVADRLAGLGVADRLDGIGDADSGAVASPSSSPDDNQAGQGPDGDGTPEENEPGASPVTVIASPTPLPVDVGDIESPKDIAEAYAKVWSNGNYDQLYDLISSAAQGRISREEFVDRYERIGVEAGIVEVQAEITGGGDDDELFPMSVDIESSRVGDIGDDNLITVVRDGDAWKVDWSPSLIFSQLGDGYVDWVSDVPQRGRILDRKGKPLAEMGRLTRVGVVPGKITNEADLLAKLQPIVDMPQEQIKARYADGQADWFMPVKDLPDAVDQAVLDQLGAIDGVAVQKVPARTYPAGPVTAHVVGYLSEITADELPELAKRGYEAGDLIGRTGIEAWGEEWLAGKRGGRLSLMAQDGSEIRVLGEVISEPAHDIVLTLDLDLQTSAFNALAEQTGSAVVLDPNNGEVLAMASKPSFDPNWFILGITDEQWAEVNDAQKQPLLNRVVANGTSIGSTFKVITAAAGMIHLGMNQHSPVSCPGEFRLEGADQVWRDWVPGGQGDMDLHTALVRSCNTTFYRIGAELDTQNEFWLPEVTRAFGFGTATGLPELYEIDGIVPDPDWKMEQVGDFWARGDAVNLAIGQGYLVATPLQVANMYAALANGGTLYQPHLTLDIVKLDGTVVKKGEVKEIGKLPINSEQVNAIRSALHDVVNASNGTAVEPFRGIQQSVSGKTGTEQTGEQAERTNAWFAAYTPSDGPRMTVVTMIQGGSAGSQVAAPVARQIIDAFYTINP